MSAGAGYQIEGALSVIERAIAAFEVVNDIHGLAYAWLSKSHAYWWQLQAAAEVAALERALHYARQSGRRSQVLSILDWLARGWAGPSPVAGSLVQLERIARAADGDRRIGATVQLSRASLQAIAGRGDDAAREMDAALATYGELGMALRVGDAGQAGYWLGLGTGDYEQARRRLEAGNHQLEAIGEESLLATSLGLLAFILLDLGQLAAAEEVAHRGLSIAAADDVSAVMTLRLALGTIEAQSGDAARAVEVAEESIDLVAASDWHVVVGDALSRAAQIHLAAGNRERATTLFADALQKYRSKGATGLAAVLQQRMVALGIELAAEE
jgi:tetratricopeptide (TPR) repeat protein